MGRPRARARILRGRPASGRSRAGARRDHAQVIHPGAVGVMADMDAARQPLVFEGQKQLGVGRCAHGGQLALGIVVGPQQMAGGPKLDDGGEILVAVAAQREGPSIPRISARKISARPACRPAGPIPPKSRHRRRHRLCADEMQARAPARQAVMPGTAARDDRLARSMPGAAETSPERLGGQQGLVVGNSGDRRRAGCAAAGDVAAAAARPRLGFACRGSVRPNARPRPGSRRWRYWPAPGRCSRISIWFGRGGEMALARHAAGYRRRGRPSASHFGSPPSSTATSLWPKTRNIHHTRAALNSPCAVVDDDAVAVAEPELADARGQISPATAACGAGDFSCLTSRQCRRRRAREYGPAGTRLAHCGL